MENLRFYSRLLNNSDENFYKDLNYIIDLSIKNHDIYKKRINFGNNYSINETRLALNYSSDDSNIKNNNITKKISKTQKKNLDNNINEPNKQDMVNINSHLVNLNDSTRFFYMISNMQFTSKIINLLIQTIKIKHHQHKTIEIINLLKNKQEESYQSSKIIVPQNYKTSNKTYIKDNKLKDGASLIIGHQKITITSENYFNNLKNFVKNYVKMRYLNE